VELAGTAVDRERLCKNPLLGSGSVTVAVTVSYATVDLLEAVFSVRAVPRLYNEPLPVGS
jgi:hypothetical protein